MVYTDKEYGYFYQQYKKAEADIKQWITSQSPPNPNGGAHCFSQLGELARKLYQNKKVEMPPHLREKLKTSIELRIKLLAHHQEKGDANTEHDFVIVMMKKVAQALFPPSEVLVVTRMVASAGIDVVPAAGARWSALSTQRSRSAPATTPKWQQATSWRCKSSDSLRAAAQEKCSTDTSQASGGLRRGRTMVRRQTV